MEGLTLPGGGKKQLKRYVSYWKGISAAKTRWSAQPQALVSTSEARERRETMSSFFKRIFERLKLLNSSLWMENWALNNLLYFKFTDGSSFENFTVPFWKELTYLNVLNLSKYFLLVVKSGEIFVHWNRLLRTEKERIHSPFPPGPLRRGWADRGSFWPRPFSWVNLTQNWWVTQKRWPFSQSWVEKLGLLRPVFEVKQPYWLEIENPTQTRESKKMIGWFLHPECLQVGLA